MTNVVRLPVRGRWAWDSRGANPAVRVSTHHRENVVNLSVWRDDICVGTVRLLPAEVTALVAGLTEGLAQMAARPAPVEGPSASDAEQLSHLDQRLARLEAALETSTWRRRLRAAVEQSGRAIRTRSLSVHEGRA